ncbi:MAG: energy-coupling factor ABC transporter permease [Bacteroides sp.]|nr:energy-coupling factor ABC transporter permease [Bacteroides sp.]
MADALVSPVVAGVAGIISGALVVVAAKKIKNSQTENIVPLMGVMGAFIFAAQMINFSIPGTGSSGHIVGGVLLSALLGPWAALVTLASVLIIQCLIFADGGLMALGCNIFNMAVCACLIAYPLIFKPLMKYPASLGKIIWVSVLACVVGLELGALAVAIETEASGITALPMPRFLLFMTPIHLAIGIGEGLATAAVLYFVQKYKPELLMQVRQPDSTSSDNIRFGKVILVFAALALLIGGAFSWIASSNPDGLEWSIYHIIGETEPAVSASDKIYGIAQNIQNATAVMPDYNTNLARIIGGIVVVLVIWVLSGLLQYRKKITPKHHE